MVVIQRGSVCFVAAAPASADMSAGCQSRHSVAHRVPEA